MSAPLVIYQKMAGKHFRWWCKSHKREATVLRIMPKPYITKVECGPVGGILLPCDCELMREAA